MAFFIDKRTGLLALPSWKKAQLEWWNLNKFMYIRFRQQLRDKLLADQQPGLVNSALGGYIRSEAISWMEFTSEYGRDKHINGICSICKTHQPGIGLVDGVSHFRCLCQEAKEEYYVINHNDKRVMIKPHSSSKMEEIEEITSLLLDLFHRSGQGK